MISSPLSKENNMAKQHKKGAGVKLVGSPAELINKILKAPADRKMVTALVTDHGSKHIQVMNALLMRRLYKLIVALERSTGQQFSEQKGLTLITGKGDDELTLPLPIPIYVSSGFDKQKITKALSKARAEQAVSFAMSLQAIEWAIGSITNQLQSKSKKRAESTPKRKIKIANTGLSNKVLELDGQSDEQ